MKLMNKKTKSKSNSVGFTLIELMVVCAIIAVLAVVVVMSYAGAKAKTRDAKRVSDLSLIASALQLYYSDKNNFASDRGSLDTSVGRVADPSIVPTGTAWEEGNTGTPTINFDLYPNYISEMPKDPKNTGHNNYSYEPVLGLLGDGQNNYGVACNASGVGSLCAYMLSTTLESSTADVGCDACYPAHNYCLPSRGDMTHKASCQ